MARDLDLHTLWFKELRYEGTPGLWHTILWVAQRVFHAPYDSISYIGMAFATAGVALVLFKAPFPRPLRWLLAFSYFMVYQYAVIARPYTLLPVLAFAAAILFKDIRHPERMTVGAGAAGKPQSSRDHHRGLPRAGLSDRRDQILGHA